MSTFDWAVVATVVLTLICAGGALFSHLRGQGPRPVLRWSALGLVPIGLLITGAMRPVVEGAQAVGRYFQTATMSLAMIVGLSIIAVAALVWLTGGRISPRTKQQAKDKRQARRQVSGVKPAVGTGRTPTQSREAKAAAQPGAGNAQPAAGKGAPVDDEMAEIEALLKSRGIE